MKENIKKDCLQTFERSIIIIQAKADKSIIEFPNSPKDDGNSRDINFNSLIDMRALIPYYKFVDDYAWYLNRSTLSNLITKKDGVGRYLIDFFSRENKPLKLFGDKIIECDELDDCLPDNIPVMYGSIKKYYNYGFSDPTCLIKLKMLK